jgi:hypothetical protein
VLIVVPSSEGKRDAPARGRPVDLAALSFPALTPTRAALLDALVATSSGPDAFRRLAVGPALAEEVLRNQRVRELAARPALEVYRGVVHEGLDAATLSPAARRRAARQVVIASSLWGLLRPADRIPPYRLHICSRLEGVDRLEPTWRSVLPAALAEAAGRRSGAIVDLRSTSYQAAGMPAGLEHRVVTVRVEDEPGGRSAGNVVVKRTRGQVARHLLESGAAPRDPVAVAAVLGTRWPARLTEPERPGRPWVLTLVVPR